MLCFNTWTTPDVTPAAWNSADHRALSRSVLDAVADAGNEWIFSDLTEQPWSGTQYVAVQTIGDPPHTVDVTDGVEAAVASLTEDGDRRVGFRLYWG